MNLTEELVRKRQRTNYPVMITIHPDINRANTRQ